MTALLQTLIALSVFMALIRPFAANAVVPSFETGEKPKKPAHSAATAKNVVSTKKQLTHHTTPEISRSQALLVEPNYVAYKLQSGDHIFKVLMKHFGLSNQAAEELIPEILRINHITDFKRLAIGQVIQIPARIKQSPAQAIEKPGADAEIKRGSSRSQIVPSPAMMQATTARQETPKGVAIAVRSVTTRDTTEMVDSILNILSLKWSKDRILESTAGTSHGASLSVKADRYLENNGDRFMISFANSDPFTYTLFRLLELDGVKLISLKPGQDLNQITASLLSALKIPFRSGVHSVILNDKNHSGATLNGLIFTRKTTPPRIILVTESPVAALTAELLTSKD